MFLAGISGADFLCSYTIVEFSLAGFECFQPVQWCNSFNHWYDLPSLPSTKLMNDAFTTLFPPGVG